MKLKLNKIYFCTGARNHDLLQFFNESSVSFEYDERVASFKALGHAKFTGEPVGICTTSGTAVSECTSAMLEAYYSKVPLILITGDRPKKLHGTGSPQTIEHEILTRSCRNSYLEVSLNELGSVNFDELKFPAHINVLVDDTLPHDLKIKYQTSINSFKEFMKNFSRPLFLFSHENKSMRGLIKRFTSTDLPFYAEALSGGRDLSYFKTEKHLVRLFSEKYFDCVVRIGHTPLSKVWRLLEKTPCPVFSFDERNLPGLSFGEVLPWDSHQIINSVEFWECLKYLDPSRTGTNDLEELKILIEKYPSSEIAIFSMINEVLKVNEIVYLGNSLIIRFFELTQKKELKIFGNRGVNGIDGQLASAIGIANSTRESVYCILGDITTYYDLSALKDIPQNLHLIIINNKGGRIFDSLGLNKKIVMEHKGDFKKICYGLNLSYSDDIKDFGKVQVLELIPVQSETESFLLEWNR